MNVLLTTDVEIWPRAWDLSSAEMRRAYRQFIVGRTAKGDFGLDFQLRTLRDHNLRGVFFVEPLFASILGQDALKDIVGLINDYGQEIQLHLHPEWLGRSTALVRFGKPRMTMRELNETEQAEVIHLGREWLQEAGAPEPSAFRAGSFGADIHTLRALHKLGIGIDSSHDPACRAGPMIDGLMDVPVSLEGVLEVPQTVYRDAIGRLRHAQVGSSSFTEIRTALKAASDQGRKAFVVLSHSAELLTGDRCRRDRVVLSRFERLCGLLADQGRQWPTSGFNGFKAADVISERECQTLEVGKWSTTCRYAGQVMRRLN